MANIEADATVQLVLAALTGQQAVAEAGEWVMRGRV